MTGRGQREIAGRGHQGAGEHRERGRGIGEAARSHLSQPCSSFTAMVSTAMIAASTNSPRAMIIAPREIRCRSMPHSFMSDRRSGQHQRYADSDDQAGAKSEWTRKLTSRTIANASRKLSWNSATSSGHNWRLVVHPERGDAKRQVGHRWCCMRAAMPGWPEFQDIAALRHGDREPQGRFAVHSHRRGRRIDRASADVSDVARV